MIEFTPYPKTPRLFRDVVITEKLDGTNCQVFITEAPAYHAIDLSHVVAWVQRGEMGYAIRAGSRNRWLGTGKNDDNHGFARWVADHADELAGLGPGQHFGEWWGGSIQRGYGLPKDEKHFSLFNVARWGGENEADRPACCDVVPVIGLGTLRAVDLALQQLRMYGSRAAPGFMNPEGVIVYHPAAGHTFKVTLDDADQGKWAS